MEVFYQSNDVANLRAAIDRARDALRRASDFCDTQTVCRCGAEYVQRQLSYAMDCCTSALRVSNKISAETLSAEIADQVSAKQFVSSLDPDQPGFSSAAS